MARIRSVLLLALTLPAHAIAPVVEVEGPPRAEVEEPHVAEEPHAESEPISRKEMIATRKVDATRKEVDALRSQQPLAPPPALPPIGQQPSCHMEVTAPFHLGGTAPLTGRHISTNHKTGTKLSLCLVRVLDQAGISLKRASHTWGFPLLNSPDVLQINLVRNPFVLVHSGYMYHRSTEDAEAWTVVPFSTMGTRYSGFNTESHRGYWQGAFDARSSFRRCSNVNISDDSTYRSALNTLSLTDGLLLECLRALHRDIPYIVASALACYHARESSTASKGRCSNVLLEDVMVDYRRGFEQHLAGPLNISKALGASFAQSCDPALANSSVMQAHATDHSGRAMAVELIREIDKTYLDGALRRAEFELLRLVDRNS